MFQNKATSTTELNKAWAFFRLASGNCQLWAKLLQQFSKPLQRGDETNITSGT